MVVLGTRLPMYAPITPVKTDNNLSSTGVPKNIITITEDIERINASDNVDLKNEGFIN
jgi:hypothetical protein